MSPGSNLAIADRLATLRQVYATQIPLQLKQLRDLYENVEQSGWQGTAIDSLLARIHDFTGATSTFGFGEHGETARIIERLLRKPAGQDESSASIDARHTRIQGLFSDLQALPLPDASQLTPLAAPRLFEPRREKAGAEAESLRIFVVDDNPLLAEQISEQIRYFGYRVETFTKLIAFEEAYRASPPDGVVLDIEFPEEQTTGPETIGRLMHELGEVAPVIFISSFDDVHARLAAARAGGMRYLLKPVAIGELIDALDTQLVTTTPAAFRVLIVDDSTAVSQLYASILESAGMKVKVINNPLQILDALAEFHPDLAVVDLYMPECSGHEVAMVIRQVEAYTDLPIVFLSAESDRDKQLSALRLGADDFLTKPIQPHHLIAAVATRAERARKVRALVQRDPLTGLLNHSALLEASDVELARSRRNGTPLTLAMIDIDQFRQLNDAHGHPVGDRVLRSFARQLRQRLRNVDIIGRYGGEEFTVVLSGTSGKAALAVIDDIREDFARVVHSSSERAFHATFSAGLACFPDFVELQRLVEAADKGLYEAKRRGRNCSVLTTPPPVRGAEPKPKA